MKSIGDYNFSSTCYNPYLESGSMIRMDSLYKPLLRRFRDHLRTRFDQNCKKSNHSRWSIEKHMQYVRLFMTEDLALPHQFLNEENIVKMMTLLFPLSKKKNEQLEEFREQSKLFQNIFRENNSALRDKFFRDPLIQHLWSKLFIIECEEVCKQYLRKVRGLPD